MGDVTELAHTADVGFEVRAGSLAELFALAAEGLARARGADADREAPDEVEDVALRRPDLERLLVEWLRELLYRSMREELVPSASARDVHVEDVRGESVAPAEDTGAKRGRDDAAEDPAYGGEHADHAVGPAEARTGGARLRARVRWRPAAGPPVREIKGITYHGLAVRRGDDGEWHARVVLDV